MVKRALAVTGFGALLVAALLYSQWKTEPLRVSGFLEADEIRVGSRVGGRVYKVHVEEGQDVEAGKLLVELEPFRLLEQQAEAEWLLTQRKEEYQLLTAGYRPQERIQAAARVDELQAALEKLEHGPRPQEIAAAQKEVEEAQAQLEFAQQQFERIEVLIGTRAAPREELDYARTQLKVARATLEVRQQRLQLLEVGTREEEIAEAKARLKEALAARDLVDEGYRSQEIAKAKAAMEAAAAQLAAIRKEIEELQVTAPARAVVQAIDLQPGDLLGANVPAVSLLDPSRLWVRAYVPENRLDIQIGQTVWVTVDSFPNQRFRAHISFISQQGEFTPRNVQTPEERSKQVFRIKATLDEGADRLRPGMAADVWFSAP